jgi:hypothetical protein
VADPSENGNETSGYIKRGDFLDYLRNCYILKKDPAPCSYIVIVLHNCIRVLVCYQA